MKANFANESREFDSYPVPDGATMEDCCELGEQAIYLFAEEHGLTIDDKGIWFRTAGNELSMYARSTNLVTFGIRFVRG